jgi:hypothetical protein
MLTIHGAFGCWSRCKRINPRSGFPGLHPSFPVKGQLDWLAVLHIVSKRPGLLATPYCSGLRCQTTPTMPSADSCAVVTTHCWSVRSPGVSPCTVDAQPLDLRLWSLMDMDFVPSCALVRPQRLLSSFCSSARTFAPRFLQTPPRGGALALRYPSPPSGWERDLHPPSTGTCPAHIIYHPQSGWFEDTPLKGGAEEGCPLQGVHEGTRLLEARQRARNHS